MNLVDGVIFKDGIRVVLQADGVINVPEYIPGEHGCGVWSVTGRNCIRISPVRGFVILEDSGEGVARNVDITAKIKFLAARSGKVVAQNLHDGFGQAPADYVDDVVMSLIGSEYIVTDDVSSALGNVSFAFDVLADIIQT